MTRAEHLQMCKKEALKCLENGSLELAWSTMISCLSLHDETSGHCAIQIGMDLIVSKNLKTKEEMKIFIEGFN